MAAPPPAEASPSGDAELTFIGNATVLLRVGGFTILTDPNFLHRGQYAKLGGGLRTRRLTEPALQIGELPPLDFIVLSHHHGDHFDEVAARELPKDLPIVTTGHAAKKLRRQGFTHPVALRTWETHVVGDSDRQARVVALPGKHAPDPLARALPEVMGSLLEFDAGNGRRFRLYVSGDTLIHDRIHEIPRRYPEIDLALLHLGGTRVLGVLLTMDAAQGVQALQLIRPRTAIPIHVDDYTVFSSPLGDFQRAVADASGLETDVRYLSRGETYSFPLA